MIIDKYENHPQCLNENKLLPILSNQKNECLSKEIAGVCEIEKELTFHIARHTFATTVTLTNGVPIESVSKMLGHKNLRTTQHYAKVLDRKVSDDMKILKDKFSILDNNILKKIFSHKLNISSNQCYLKLLRLYYLLKKHKHHFSNFILVILLTK